MGRQRCLRRLPARLAKHQISRRDVARDAALLDELRERPEEATHRLANQRRAAFHRLHLANRRAVLPRVSSTSAYSLHATHLTGIRTRAWSPSLAEMAAHKAFLARRHGPLLVRPPLARIKNHHDPSRGAYRLTVDWLGRTAFQRAFHRSPQRGCCVRRARCPANATSRGDRGSSREDAGRRSSWPIATPSGVPADSIKWANPRVPTGADPAGTIAQVNCPHSLISKEKRPWHQ